MQSVVLAVVNGVSYVTSDEESKGRGLAMGLLETIRRASEVVMNLVVVLLIAWHPENTVELCLVLLLHIPALLIPMIFALIKFAPTNEVAHVEGKSK